MDQTLIETLRVALLSLKQNPEFNQMIARRDKALQKYQPLFSAQHIPKLTELEFRSFLLYENNGHWNGLHRQGPKICADMDNLRASLLILLDETIPISRRFDEAVTRVPGMGKAIATAFLLVAFPNKYGVWNRTSEFGMEQLRAFPERERGESLGEQYKKVNEKLVSAAEQLQIDLWTLDSLWWFAFVAPEAGKAECTTDGPVEVLQAHDQRFALEKHLHYFIWENWEKLDLSKDWDIYGEPGDPDLGIEYRTPIGRIDILAKHKTEPKWLVIELKRDQSSDQVVGQILRYIGFIQTYRGEKVEGLIISHEVDRAIQYAISAIQNVKLQTYGVSFCLNEVKDLVKV